MTPQSMEELKEALHHEYGAWQRQLLVKQLVWHSRTPTLQWEHVMQEKKVE